MEGGKGRNRLTDLETILVDQVRDDGALTWVRVVVVDIMRSKYIWDILKR